MESKTTPGVPVPFGPLARVHRRARRAAALIRGLALAAVLTLGGALAAAAGYQEGIAAFETGDYATARRELHVLAQQGHPGAQFTLAQMYRFGAGVPQNDA